MQSSSLALLSSLKRSVCSMGELFLYPAMETGADAQP